MFLITYRHKAFLKRVFMFNLKVILPTTIDKSQSLRIIYIIEFYNL